MKQVTSKWKDPQYKRAYQHEWATAKFERRKVNHDNIAKLLSEIRRTNGKVEPLEPVSQKPMSTWALRKAERQAKEEATKPYELGLEQCPFCGAAFFRKVNDKYEPIKMNHCDPCAKRFYYYNGVKQ